MWMFEKPLAEVTEQDLQALVDSAFEEGTLIDYKETLPGNSDGDKFNLRADVVAFANSSGGLLIFGMREKEGKASELVGLAGINADAEILRLENAILAGVQPRIKVTTQPIPLASGRIAIIMRIPRSWTGPHAIVRDDWLRFAMRGSKGNHYLDVGQVRAAMIGTESAIERVRNFRADRLAQVMANETVVELVDEPKLILHVVPLNAFAPGVNYDVAALESEMQVFQHLTPMGTSASDNRRLNFDGLLTYGTHRNIANTYLQVFRNGAIEAVDADSLTLPTNPQYIPSLLFERSLIHELPRALALLEWLGAEPPVAVMVALTGVRGRALAVSDPLRRVVRWHEPDPIDRDVLIVPEILLESLKVDADKALKPAIDTIWNAGGYSQSPNYRDGKWFGDSSAR